MGHLYWSVLYLTVMIPAAWVKYSLWYTLSIKYYCPDDWYWSVIVVVVWDSEVYDGFPDVVKSEYGPKMARLPWPAILDGSVSVAL